MKTILALLATLQINNMQPNLDRAQIYCLSKAVYHESRGEQITGQVAVAYVVLNRVNSDNYPDNICSVVYQDNQFTDIKKTKPNYTSKAWARAVEVATFAKIGFVEDPTNGATHYYNPDKVKKSPKWASKMKRLLKIGGHVFFKEE